MRCADTSQGTDYKHFKMTCLFLSYLHLCSVLFLPQIPWKLNYRELRASLQVLGIKPRHSGRAAAGAVKLRAVSLGPSY